MIDLTTWAAALRCPDCGAWGLNALTGEGGGLACNDCGADFQLLNGKPVLLSHDNALFPVSAYSAPPTEKPAGIERSGLKRFIPDASVNLASERMLSRLGMDVAGRGGGTILVVGGGRQRSWLDHLLGIGKNIQTIYSDIDIAADVDLFADGHTLPFIDGVFDAVVTTAVLEHVLYPEQVAKEICRVLKPSGLLYSELPFMQQVHEGAYDFTRYTLSGHRRLFNTFQEIDAGMVAGPATALVWSIENFALAFVRKSVFRNLTKGFVRVLFGWLQYLDHLLINRPEAMDAASCTYFFGSKAVTPVSDSAIIAKYVGAKHLTHI